MQIALAIVGCAFILFAIMLRSNWIASLVCAVIGVIALLKLFPIF